MMTTERIVLIEETEGNDVSLQVKCVMCGEFHEVVVTKESLAEFQSPNRRNIQDVFPYLSPSDRELLLTNICPNCWTKMFGDDEFDDEF